MIIQINIDQDSLEKELNNILLKKVGKKLSDEQEKQIINRIQFFLLKHTKINLDPFEESDPKFGIGIEINI